MQRLAARATANMRAPGHVAPWVRRFVRNVWGPIARLAYRPTLEGLENLPDGAFLLVANHSGALGIAEIMSFAVLYEAAYGESRPIAGFAHPFGFVVWPLRLLMRDLGAVPSTYDAAELALEAGVPLLVFPGGDVEAGRPIWRASDVDFGGRVGFLKIARRAGVPIVPMGIEGSHYTAPIVWQSRLLAWLFVLPRLFGVKRYPLTLLAIAGAAALVALLPSLGWIRFALAALWVSSPFALVPWVPWRVRIRVGAPMPIAELVPTEEAYASALAKVEAAVKELSTRSPSRR